MIPSPRALLTFGVLLGWAPVASIFSCNKQQVTWVRFNGDDTAQVQITASDVGPPVTTDLTSTSGAIVVGQAEVDPGSGPVGTDHQVVVTVDNAYVDEVQRVSLEVDSGTRGVSDFELTQDSADKGYWFLDIQSVGDPGETRTDVFSFQLWTPQTQVINPDTAGS